MHSMVDWVPAWSRSLAFAHSRRRDDGVDGASSGIESALG